MNHIFVCQTPFQLMYAHRIVQCLLLNKQSHSKVIIIHANISSKLDLDGVKYYNYLISGSLLLRAKHFLKCFNFIKQAIKKSPSNSTFYISHIGGFYSNYIFYNKPKNVKLNLFYEGILSFYDYREPFNRAHFKRLMLSFLMCFKYIYTQKIFPYDSPKISKIYTPFQQLSKGSEKKIKEVTFNKGNYFSERSNGVLILGGPVSYLEQFYETCVKNIINTYPEHTIYYKGHSSFDKENKKHKNLFEKVMKAKNLDFHELSIDQPIELLFFDLKIGEIHSYPSSSIVNLNAIDSSKRFYCYVNSSINKKIISIFKTLNFNIEHL